MKSSELDFRRADIRSSIAAELIHALNVELQRRYPEEGDNHFRLDREEVGEGRGAFLIAYLHNEPVACGAIRRIGADTAEIKRMYVEPRVRRQGVGRHLLAQLEDEGRRLGLKRIVLETGSRQPEALALYAAAGFVPIAPFGEYEDSPLSVCLSKAL